MLRWLTDMWWRFVFWYKKQTGWVELKKNITCVGTIKSTGLAKDGDAMFDLIPDPGYDWLITGFGGDQPHAFIHCEIPPWIRGNVRELHKYLRPGDKVEVTGDWGWDGVHMEYKWYGWEVISAIFRHQPNFKRGWFEIHPVKNIILKSSYV